MSHFILTPSVRAGEAPEGMFTAEEYAAVERFYHDEKPGMLHSLDRVAKRVGVGALLAKDETGRRGLGAFKILGVAYAMARLRKDERLPYGAVVACATDGNHGRAVAHTAERMGLESHVFLPGHASQARLDAIAKEGAHVHVVGGNYDDAVRQAAREAEAHGWLVISDTSWPGYEEIPRWIMAGYTQILMEASRQWIAPPDAVFVQAGVGGFACAVGSWFARAFGKWRPYLVLCQPAQSACVVEAARRGAPVPLQGQMETVMDCLSAGEVSHTAWPVLSPIYDAYMTVGDDEAVAAAEMLRKEGIPAGYSGACGMAAFLGVMRDADGGLREAAGLGKESRVMVIVTDAQP